MRKRARGCTGQRADGTPSLMRHLGIVLALKFAALAIIWLALFMPYRVAVDAAAMQQRFAHAPAASHGVSDDRSHAR